MRNLQLLLRKEQNISDMNLFGHCIALSYTVSQVSLHLIHDMHRTLGMNRHTTEPVSTTENAKKSGMAAYSRELQLRDFDFDDSKMACQLLTRS
jgi:hypothetical protein